MRVMKRRLAMTLAVSLAGVSILAGCDDDPDPVTPAVFAVEATADDGAKALAMPESVEAGPVTLELTNSDTVPRSLQIVRIDGDETVEDVLAVVQDEEEGAPIPDFLQDGGGLGDVAPGQTAGATQVLAPGRYAAWDDAEDHAELGAYGEFEVTGEPSDAELPEVPGRVTATDDGADEYGFEFEGLAAGANEVRFENTGEELHHALFFPIGEGATIDDVRDFFTGPDEPEGPPPLEFERGVGTAVIDGGIAQNITLELPAGDYAVLCFLPDREGGPPHAVQGMIESLTIE